MAGFNYRDTSGYVTDGAGDTYVLPGDAHPVVRDGETFGWVGTAPTGVNRDSGVDSRLAGNNNRLNGGTQRLFVVNSGNGTFDVTLAMGDAIFAQTEQVVEIVDVDTSNVVQAVLLSFAGEGTGATQWMDASDVLRTSEADWVSNNVTAQVTVTNGRLGVRIGGTGSGFTTLNHMAYVASATGPAISAPTTFTDGTDGTITGTDLGTLASSGDVALIDTTGGGTFRRTQTYGTVTATSIADVEYETGDQELRLGATGPVSAVPVAPDVTAPGITAYVTEIEIDDGTNPADTITATSNAATGLQTVQTMIATASTTGVFKPAWVTVEDNHLCTLPTVQNGVNLTIDNAGDVSWLTSEMTAAGGSINVILVYTSKATGQSSKITVNFNDGTSTGGSNALSIGIGIGI